MSQRWWIIFILVWSISIGGCSNRLEPNQGTLQTDIKGMLSKEEAIGAVMNLPEIKALKEAGKEIEIKGMHEPTEEEPIWEITIADKDGKVNQTYILNGYTGEVLESIADHTHDEDIEEMKKDMTDTLKWVFESWQSFHYSSYEPSRLGLAFDLNFRLAYIFDNYDENRELVEKQKITSEVKITEIKDTGMAFNEEDHTLYGQLRVVALYQQQINGEKLAEPVEVLIFSKNHLDSEEGWQITNVDMYKTDQSSNDFEKLFFGFKK